MLLSKSATFTEKVWRNQLFDSSILGLCIGNNSTFTNAWSSLAWVIRGTGECRQPMQKALNIFFESMLSGSRLTALQWKLEPNKAHWQWKPQPHRALLSARRQALQSAPDLTAKTQKSYQTVRKVSPQPFSFHLDLLLTVMIIESCDLQTSSAMLRWRIFIRHRVPANTGLLKRVKFSGKSVGRAYAQHCQNDVIPHHKLLA